MTTLSARPRGPRAAVLMEARLRAPADSAADGSVLRKRTQTEKRNDFNRSSRARHLTVVQNGRPGDLAEQGNYILENGRRKGTEGRQRPESASLAAATVQ